MQKDWDSISFQLMRKIEQQDRQIQTYEKEIEESNEMITKGSKYFESTFNEILEELETCGSVNKKMKDDLRSTIQLWKDYKTHIEVSNLIRKRLRNRTG